MAFVSDNQPSAQHAVGTSLQGEGYADYHVSCQKLSETGANPMTEQLTRRGFTTKTLGALLTYTLLEDLANQDLFAAAVKPITTNTLRTIIFNRVGS